MMMPIEAIARFVPAVAIADDDVVARHNAIVLRRDAIVLIGNAVVLLCDLLVLLRDDRVIVLHIRLPRARCVHSRRVVSRIHVRLIIRVGVMHAHVLMRAHIVLRLHVALRLHALFVRDIRIVLRDGGLLIRVPLGVFVLFLSLRLADLRQRQPQTQTKSKNSFHSV